MGYLVASTTTASPVVVVSGETALMDFRFWRTPLAVAFALALVAVACGGGSDTSEPASPTSENTADETDETGVDAVDDDDSAADDEPVADESDEPETAPLEDEDQITSAGEGSSSTTGDPVYGGEVTWGLTNDGTGFNTTAAVAPGSIRVISALTDQIVGLNEDGTWAPNMAETIVPNDDFTIWTITMRPGISFHDGVAVDAAAVAANMQAFKDSGTTGVTWAVVDEIVVVGEMSLEVRMKSPWAAFPHQLVGQPGWMVSPETIGQNDTFVGTGPFMLESWTPNDGARVVRNPNYWRDGLPYLDAINFKFLVDQTVKRQALEAGDIDGYIGPGDQDILDYLDDDAVDVWIGAAGANEYLFVLNTTKAPFDDLRVRQALAYATDRQFIVDTFRSGLTVPANGPLNPSSKWFAETEYPTYDPEMAAALVTEYEAEVGPIQFEVSAEPNASTIEVIEVVISFWEDAGIEAEVKEIGPGQSAITAIIDDFQAISWFQFGTPDPDGLYAFMHSSAGIINWSNLQSDKLDEGLEIGRQNDDYETRLQGYALVQEALAEELPMIWIDHLNGVEAAVTVPELHGIGVTGILPDGQASLPMTSGNFFAWTSVWLEE